MIKNERKILCAILTWFMLLALLTGCDPSGYQSSNPELYSVVANTLIGAGSSHFEHTNIIERESYGRTAGRNKYRYKNRE